MSDLFNRVQELLREADVCFFVCDLDQEVLAVFTERSRSCVVKLWISEHGSGLFLGTAMPFIAPDDPLAAVIFEEILAVNDACAMASFGRDPETGSLSASATWIPTEIEALDVAQAMRGFASDVITVLERIDEVRATGKTRHRRELEENIDNLFNSIPAAVGD